MFQVFNTKTHQKEGFIPLNPEQITFYGCGPTVYNYAHIGNLRAYVFYDLLNRYLRFKGYKVKFAMNLTDVDDKTIRDSQKAGVPLREWTQKYADAFFEDCAKLNIKKPDVIIKATEEMPAMIELTQTLLDKGYAYQTKTGDIFFKIDKFPDYGKMAGIEAKNLLTNADGRLSDEYEKEDARDFALWKAWVPADGDNVWDAPFGKGRPGWSLECSAMSRKYLGQPIDFHVGGVDLIFPHHTNEIAQSECAYGCEFVRYWMHNAHITVNGKKMSKSAGNFYTLRDLLNKGHSALAIRYEFVKAHYRMTMDFQEEALKGNQSALNRFKDLQERLPHTNGTGWADCETTIGKMLHDFEEAMDDDLNTPVALSVLFDFVSTVNKAFDTISAPQAAAIQTALEKADSVLGIMPPVSQRTLTAEEQALIDQRESYRKQKDWAQADAIKAQLTQRGIVVKDTPTGPQVSFT